MDIFIESPESASSSASTPAPYLSPVADGDTPQAVGVSHEPPDDPASSPPVDDRNLIRVPIYAWVTGNNSALVHVRKIAVGGFGDVHEVVLILTNFR
jgi:hypothetical protein